MFHIRKVVHGCDFYSTIESGNEIFDASFDRRFYYSIHFLREECFIVYCFTGPGLEQQNLICLKNTFISFVTQPSRSWESLFPTVLKGSRSAAKLGDRQKTRSLQSRGHLFFFHPLLLFSSQQDAELAEISVRAPQNVSRQPGRESSVGKFCFGFGIL